MDLGKPLSCVRSSRTPRPAGSGTRPSEPAGGGSRVRQADPASDGGCGRAGGRVVFPARSGRGCMHCTAGWIAGPLALEALGPGPGPSRPGPVPAKGGPVAGVGAGLRAGAAWLCGLWGARGLNYHNKRAAAANSREGSAPAAVGRRGGPAAVGPRRLRVGSEGRALQSPSRRAQGAGPARRAGRSGGPARRRTALRIRVGGCRGESVGLGCGAAQSA